MNELKGGINITKPTYSPLDVKSLTLKLDLEKEGWYMASIDTPNGPQVISRGTNWRETYKDALYAIKETSIRERDDFNLPLVGYRNRLTATIMEASAQIAKQKRTNGIHTSEINSEGGK